MGFSVHLLTSFHIAHIVQQKDLFQLALVYKCVALCIFDVKPLNIRFCGKRNGHMELLPQTKPEYKERKVLQPL